MARMGIKAKGFSLAEVLIAVGILGAGLLMVAAVFPAAIHYTTVTMDQTIAAAAADEAFAKIKMYAIGNPAITADDVDIAAMASINNRAQKDINDADFFRAMEQVNENDANEFFYPSAGTDIKAKQYSWFGLCRVLDESTRRVQVTVFITKRTAAGKYYQRNQDDGRIEWGGTPPVISPKGRPIPVKIDVSWDNIRPKELEIAGTNADQDKTLIYDGSIIVDDKTGKIYRVLERYKNEGGGEDKFILLDKKWEGGDSGTVWVIPPPADGGRNPCVAVYQREIMF